LEARATLTLRLMTTSLTNGIHGAGILFTNWTADAIQTIAGLVIRAILVVLAMTCDARNEGTSLCASRTLADGLVILWQALGSTATTHLAMGTRIHAVLIQASLVVRAIRINLTFS